MNSEKFITKVIKRTDDGKLKWKYVNDGQGRNYLSTVAKSGEILEIFWWGNVFTPRSCSMRIFENVNCFEKANSMITVSVVWDIVDYFLKKSDIDSEIYNKITENPDDKLDRIDL